MAVATAPLSTPEMSTSAEHEEQPVSTADNEPLTTKQKELVEKTWKFVEGDLQGAGILLFTKWVVMCATKRIEVVSCLHTISTLKKEYIKIGQVATFST